MNVNKTYSTLINDKPILKSRSYILNNGATVTAISMTYTALASSSLVAAATSVGSVVTFTAGSSHRLQTGQLVTISGATDSAFNGNFLITVTSATAFTYLLVQPTASTTTAGTTVVRYTPIFQQAIVTAASTNSDTVYIGPDLNADMVPLDAGGVYVIQAPVSHREDLGDWFYKSATASQKLNIVFV